MKIQYIFAALAASAMMTACNADMDIDIADPILAAPNAEAITGSLQGNDYILTWPANGKSKMQVTRYVNGNKAGMETVEGNTYTHHDVDTNVPYMYIFKLTDGKNYSPGVIKEFRRPGASKCDGLEMTQVETPTGYNAEIKWNANPTATSYKIQITDGGVRDVNRTLEASETSYTINNVKEGETWNVTLTAVNAEGASLPISNSLRIGKLAVAYLSYYDTEDELLDKGDDDEAYGWMWFHANYPNGKFLPFSQINSTDVLDPYRVIFYMRDIDEPGVKGDAWTYPEKVRNATPFITEWYKNGGSMLLWGHSTTYVGVMGRLDLDLMKKNDHNIGYGGNFNGDTWKMSVKLNTGSFVKDNSNHPIYRGLDVEDAKVDDRETKFLAVKSGAFTEDHNCLFFNLPSYFTGIGNEEEACYNASTRIYGLIPLGTWDGQCKWVSQLNVWECQPGNTEFKGTLICVGNGGCNFYLKQSDGSFDVRKQPSANAYQSNLETMAKNAIEYLKTR